MDNAILAGHRLQEEINKTPFMLANRDERINITVTMAVVLKRHNESFDEALNRADQMLYYGKGNGRNQVVSEHDPIQLTTADNRQIRRTAEPATGLND
jgi:PleD family two-component response regulator